MDSNSVNRLINRFKPVDLKAVEESKKVAVHFKAREYLRAKYVCIPPKVHVTLSVNYFTKGTQNRIGY